MFELQALLPSLVNPGSAWGQTAAPHLVAHYERAQGGGGGGGHGAALRRGFGAAPGVADQGTRAAAGVRAGHCGERERRQWERRRGVRVWVACVRGQSHVNTDTT